MKRQDRLSSKRAASRGQGPLAERQGRAAPKRPPGEERFRALLDQAGEALLVARVPSGRLVDAAGAACRLLGLSRRQLLARSLRDLVRQARQMDALLAKRPEAVGEEKVFRAVPAKGGGEGIPVEMSVRFGAFRGARYAVALLRERSGRGETEALRRERDKAQKYLDVAGVILVVIDADQRVSLINRKGCEVLGYREEEILGENWFDRFVPERIRESVKGGFFRLLDGEIEPMEYFENPVVTKSGQEKIIAWHNTVLRDGAGRIVRTLSSGEDITERRKAEEELSKYRERLEDLVQKRTADFTASEEKYRTLVENVPLAVYRLGPRGEVIFVNQFVKDMLGYSPSEIYSEPGLWTRRILEEDRPKVERLREMSLRLGEGFFAEYRVKHRDGHTVYAADHAIPFRGADGTILSVDGILMDVTGRIRLQEKLIQAEGIRTIGEVSARLAHEIRNPLASAGGFARRLLSSMSPRDPNREKMEIVLKEVGRLEAILRMILTSLQPLELELTRVDPNRMVGDVLRAMAGEIREAKARVERRFGRRLPEVSLDRPQMERAVEALIRKALAQMPKGATLSVSTSRQDGMFRLALRYPVPNLMPDDVESFFYPFIASPAAEDRADAVDLPRARILAHKHGGLIEVKRQGPADLLVQVSLPV